MRKVQHVVLEGLDAAGKATQSKLLRGAYERLGVEARVYSFPRYETPIGSAILRHLKGETRMSQRTLVPHGALMDEDWSALAPEDLAAFQCLMLADKYDALADMQVDWEMGRVVICDRWWQSAMAFGAADGLDPTWLARIHSGLPNRLGAEAVLDVNIYVEVSPEEAFKRRPAARDRYERDREKQARIKENYDRLWTNAGAGYVRVDGVGTTEEVHRRIWKAVEGRE